ncbi:MAG TPA: hypothetical protein VJ810_32810 [Blastocatellia bacterium]|nr:hypothetical protein [Blastocatellia bacterium]
MPVTLSLSSVDLDDEDLLELILKIKADDLRADDMAKLVQTIKKAVEGMND